MELIEVNYSQQDLYLEFKKETGEYVDNIATNLNNPYVKWLEEIAIKAKKAELIDQAIYVNILKEIAEQESKEEESCSCNGCHCGKIDPEFEKHLDHYMELKGEEKDSVPEKFREKFERSVKQLANGETISKSLEELREMGGDQVPTPDRIGFNEHNK